MIIALAGRAGCGKSTVASMVPDSRVFSFADPMKLFCQQLFGWDKETLWGSSELRNKPDPRWVRPDGSLLTPRYALQTLGTEWGRNCSPDLWARAGVAMASAWVGETGFDAVLCDCRFVNEAQAVRDAGGEVWRIERPGAGLAGEAALHPSELEQESEAFKALVTRTIVNDGSLDQLRAQLPEHNRCSEFDRRR